MKIPTGEGNRRKFEHLALHDSLTGLPNRLLFGDRLVMALSQARRHQKQLATFFVDLDHFKVINDSMGHEVGDEALRAVAGRLKAMVREEDTLARFGGDEFVLLATGVTSVEDVATVSRKILDALRPPFSLAGREVSITASVGASVFPADGPDADVLVRNADRAMYRAKRRGRNTYQLFTPEATASSGARLNLEAQLRNALRTGEFLLHYQPIVDLTDGRVLGVEALLRWQPAEGALLSPGTFIPVAETSDLIVPISRWVLRTGCEQCAAWRNGSRVPVSVAVNLSASVFQQPDLIADVSRALEEAGLPAECLDLEITESCAMQNVEFSIATLQRLKDLGVRISLDDFGTGYSSLGYLKKLPLDRIKIDKSFVKNVATDSDDAAIVSAVVAMTHQMKLAVVAEGIETTDQLAFLRALRCEQGQGFLFSHPLPAEAVERTLRQSSGRVPPFRHLFQA